MTLHCVKIIYRTQNLRSYIIDGVKGIFSLIWFQYGNRIMFRSAVVISEPVYHQRNWAKRPWQFNAFLSSQLRFPTFKREARRNPLIQLLSTRVSIQLGLMPTLSSPKQPHQTLRTIKHPLWMSDRFFNSQVVHIRVRYKDSPAHQWLTK